MFNEHSRLVFQRAFQLCAQNRTPENKAEFLSAVKVLLFSGGLAFSDIAPILAFIDVESKSPINLRQRGARLIYKGLHALMRWRFRDRPMWNDYRMARWMFTRAASDVLPILLQVHSRPAGHPVYDSGHWMLRSVCDNDPEFHKQFSVIWGAGISGALSSLVLSIPGVVRGCPDCADIYEGRGVYHNGRVVSAPDGCGNDRPGGVG